MSWDGWELLRRLGVTTQPNDQFLCSADRFAEWANDRKQPMMEDFHRFQRRHLDISSNRMANRSTVA